MHQLRARSLLVIAALTVVLLGATTIPAIAPSAHADEIDASTTTATLAGGTLFAGPMTPTSYRTAGGWRKEVTIGAPPGTGLFKRYWEMQWGTTTPAGSFWRLDPEGGGVWLMNASTGKIAGRVHTPWGYDRLGSRIPTRLTIGGLDGDYLRLSYTLPATRDRFPVTIDPHFTWGWITGTIYFNKQETALIGVGGGLLASMIASAPPPWNAVLALYSTYITTLAGIASASNQCIAVRSQPLLGSIAYLYSGSAGDGYCR
jgi:hypothetical protein